MSIKDLGGPDLQYNSSTGAGQKGITGGLGANNVGLQVVTEGTVSEVAADHVILTYGDGPSLRFNIDAPSGTPPTIGTLVQGAGVVTLSTSESVTTPVIRVKDYNSFSAL